MMTKYSYLRVKPDGSYSHERTKAYERDRNNWPAPALASKSTVIKTVIELGLQPTTLVEWANMVGPITKQPEEVLNLVNLANSYPKDLRHKNGKFFYGVWLCGEYITDIDELPRLIAIIQKTTHQPI